MGVTSLSYIEGTTYIIFYKESIKQQMSWSSGSCNLSALSSTVLSKPYVERLHCGCFSYGYFYILLFVQITLTQCRAEATEEHMCWEWISWWWGGDHDG